MFSSVRPSFPTQRPGLVVGLVLIGAALAACNPPGGPVDDPASSADQPPASEAPPGTRDAGQGANPDLAPPAAGEAARPGGAGETAGAGEPGAQPARSAEPAGARAQLMPTEGHEATGTVEIRTDADGLLAIEAALSGLAPGAHGIHIHEAGDCSAPDGSSAGDHFAPEGDAHGAPSDPPAEHHAGDLGNITADESGRANETFEDDELSLEGPVSVIGRAVVVHSGEDDLTSQPDGNSGDPVACGVIRRVDHAVAAR